MTNNSRQPSGNPGLGAFACASPRGFTLLEMMVSIFIVAMISVFAFSSFSSFFVRHRVQDAASDLYIALAQTRAEALKRNVPVAIAPAAAGTWTAGWKVPDPQNAGSYVLVHDAVQSISIASTAPGTGLTYQPTGRLAGTFVTLPQFNFTATRGSYTYSMCIRIDPSGRAYEVATSCF